jgi:hypothetical protein
LAESVGQAPPYIFVCGDPPFAVTRKLASRAGVELTVLDIDHIIA